MKCPPLPDRTIHIHCPRCEAENSITIQYDRPDPSVGYGGGVSCDEPCTTCGYEPTDRELSGVERDVQQAWVDEWADREADRWKEREER